MFSNKLKSHYKVSVIMPVYNSQNFLFFAINSVLSQSYSNFELIIIDDHSSDYSREIIQFFAQKDLRIIMLYNNKNMGVAYSRNIGLEKASGDYIAFIDSDDIWEKEKLEKQLFFMGKDIEFSFTASSFIDENGISLKRKISVPKNVDYKKLFFNNVIPCSSVILTKKLAKTISMSSKYLHEDLLAWLLILKKNKFAFGLNEVLLNYRIHKSSKSINKFKSFVMNYNLYKELGYNNFFSFLFVLIHNLFVFNKYIGVL